MYVIIIAAGSGERISNDIKNTPKSIETELESIETG